MRFYSEVVMTFRSLRKWPRIVRAHSKRSYNLDLWALWLFLFRNELWHALLLLFLYLEVNYSLQVTLPDTEYLLDYDNLSSVPAQELASTFVAEVIMLLCYKPI